MDKELLNKILPYCGYGLKVSIYDEYDKMALNDIAVIIGVRIKDDCFMVKRDINYPMSFDINMKENKPILFPPDCLNWEIETEYGKEVPWIELSKIVYETIRTRYSEIKDIKLMTEITTTYTEITSNHDVTYVFQYDCIYAWFRLTCGRLNITFNPVPVLNYLYSRHIAFNLESSEYVSIESLEKNPYKIK